MNVFLSEEEIEVVNFQLSEQDYQKIGYLKGSATERAERFAIWQKYLYEMIEYSMKSA